MRKLLYAIIIIAFISCEEEEVENTNINNDIPPNPPSLITPSDGSTLIQYDYYDPIYFEWSVASDPDDDVSAYQWHIADNPSFSSSSFFTMETTNTYSNTDQYSTPRPYLEDNQVYYWKVRTRDSNYNYSTFSETWSFYVEGYNDPPSEPILIFPIDETECSNSYLTFQWNYANDPQGDAVTYKLHIDTLPQFDESPGIYEAFGNNNYTLNLPEGTHLYWKIEVSDGQESTFSETRSLFTQGNGAVNTAPQLQYLSPQDGAIVTGNSINLSWIGDDLETNNSDLSYRVYASEIGSSLNLLQEGNSIQYTLSNLQSGTEYQWLIYVTDSDGATNVGDIQTFNVQ